MATISELMTWSIVGSDLKSYLGVAGSAEDATLQLWLGAMTASADSYIDITDEDDEFESLPDPVKLAVFLSVAVLRGRHGRQDGLRAATTASLSETYDLRAAFVADAAFSAAR